MTTTTNQLPTDPTQRVDSGYSGVLTIRRARNREQRPDIRPDSFLVLVESDIVGTRLWLTREEAAELAAALKLASAIASCTNDARFLADAVRDGLDRRGVSPTTAARETGISRHRLRKLLAGDVPMTGDGLKAISAVGGESELRTLYVQRLPGTDSDRFVFHLYVSGGGSEGGPGLALVEGVPRAIPRSIEPEQAREMAEALIRGAEYVEASRTAKCLSCGKAVAPQDLLDESGDRATVGYGTCAECWRKSNREARPNLQVIRG